MDVPEDERAFLEKAKRRILDHARERRRAGRTDVIHAVVRSTSGAVYEGVPFESDAPQFNFCAERHAIDELGEDATVYCGSFVREEDGWEAFADVERYDTGELYPQHRPHPAWE